MSKGRRILAGLIMAVVAACATPLASAVDGVVLIDQNKAMAGGVTPGDTAGFPIWVTQPGSYRLTSNLVVPDNHTSGIEVRASNVFIDLNGFTIQGPGTANPASPAVTGFGITSVIRDSTGHVVLQSRFVSVVNGTIAGMGAGGVELKSDGRVQNMHVHDNFGVGIEAADIPSNLLVVDNVLANNRFGSLRTDILTSELAVIRGNTVEGEIFVVCPGVIIGNSATAIITVDAGCTRSQNSPAP